MAQPAFNPGISPRRVDRAAPARRRTEAPAPTEMELKFAELQKDYADLHEAIFEAAQVHRRLCAPRQLRFRNFEIASEIFAVRHLPGDFFAREQGFDGVVLALVDTRGNALPADMRTTHMVGMVRAHTSRTSARERIVQ